MKDAPKKMVCPYVSRVRRIHGDARFEHHQYCSSHSHQRTEYQLDPHEVGRDALLPRHYLHLTALWPPF